MSILFQRLLILRGEYFNALSVADLCFFHECIKGEEWDSNDLIAMLRVYDEKLYPHIN